MSMPARILSSSPPRCGEPPLPEDANDSVPGLALPRAINSLTLRTGSVALTISTLGEATSWVMGAKLRRVS